MKAFFQLIACLLFISLTASTCEPCLETCDDFDIVIDSRDPTLIIDSVVYTTEDFKVFSNYQNAAYPTIIFGIPINPTKDKSEMVIYTNKGDNKVQFQHKYTEFYDDECHDYVFRLATAEATSSTLKVSKGKRDFECMTFYMEY